MKPMNRRPLHWLLLAAALVTVWSFWSPTPPESPPARRSAAAPGLISKPARATNVAAADVAWNGWRAQLPAAKPAVEDVTEWPANRVETFDKFRAWQVQYLAAGNNVGLEAEGVKLAKARRAAMARWIERDPEFALAQALSPDERRDLPAAVLAELESRIDGRGHYFVMVRCGDKVRADQQFFRQAQIDGKTYSAFVYGRRYQQTTKYDLPLHGVALDGLLALHESPVRQLDPLEARDRGFGVQGIPLDTGRVVQLAASAQDAFAIEANLKQRESGRSPYTAAMNGSIPPPVDVAAFPPSPGWTLGVKRFLVIRVDFSDDPGGPFDRNSGQTITTNAMDAVMANVNQFYLDNSQGQTSIQTFHLPAVLRMPQTKAAYDVGTPDDLRTDMIAAAVAYDQANGNTGAFNPATYDLDTVVFSDISGPNWQFGGLAGVGSKRMWVNAEFSLRIMAHELGHNYGLLHANRWDVTGTDPIDPAGTQLDYGDEYDMMGGNSGNRPIPFNEWFKAYLGWLNVSQWRTAPTGGVYRLFRHDHTNASGIRGITVGQTNDRSYWLGFRRDLTNYSANSFGATNFLANGVEIRWGMQAPGLASNMAGEASRLLNFTPGTANFTRHPLPVGQTFTDPAFNLSITPLAVGGNSPTQYIDLNITYSTPPSTITQSPTNVTVNEGGTATFSVAATGGAPITYSWTFNNVVIPGATSSTLTLTGVTTNQGGTYVARVTNPGGTVNSQPAVLTVIPVGPFTNGSFELPDINAGQILPIGSSAITGWVVGGATTVFWVDVNEPGAIPLAGQQYVAFNQGNLPAGGTLSQTFTTVPGSTYQVSYNVGRYGGGVGPLSLQATATSSSSNVLGVLDSAAPSAVGWSGSQYLTFVATTPTTTLTFLDTSLTTSAVDVILDNVAVRELVITAFTNGSFELPVLAATVTGTNGSTMVTGWTIGGASPVGHIRGQLLGQGALDGAQWIGFNGNNLPPGDSIAQTFLTTPGDTYSVSFNVVQLGNAGNTMSIRGTATSSTGQSLGTLNAVAPVSGWSPPHSFNFVATSATSTLTFLDTSLATFGVDVFLDNVVVRRLGPTPAGLLAHWRFDEAPGSTVAVDSTGNFNGTNSPTGATFATGGRVGNAMRLTSSQNGFVDMGNNLGLGSNDFTVSGWVRSTPGDTTGFATLLSKHNQTFANGYILGYNHTAIANGLDHAFFYAGTRTIPSMGFTIVEVPVSTTVVNDGNWHHLVGVYQRSGNTLIYVDGVPVEGSIASSSVPTSAAPFLIGGSTAGTTPVGNLNGLVDDVQIYNRALSDTEIDVIFRNPGVEITTVPIITVPPQDQTLPVGSAATFSVTAVSTFPGNGPIRYQWLRNGTNLPGQTSSNLTLANVQISDSGSYSVLAANTAGPTLSPAANLNVITFTPLAHWKFDETPGATVAVDSQGNFNGTNSPSGASFVSTGRSGNALSLTRTQSGYVDMGNVLSFASGSYSLVAWVKTAPGDVQDNQVVLGKHISGFHNGYFLLVNTTGGGLIPGKASLVTGAPGIATPTPVETPVSTNSVNDGNWHQIVAVHNLFTGIKSIYVDGAPLEDAKPVEPVTVNLTSPFLVGGMFSGGAISGLFDGLLDDIQIYNRPLEDAEINFLYQNPGQPITGAPIVSGQPQDLSVVLGQTATFAVTNIGIAPFTYQWRFNGTPIPGETNTTLTLNNVQTNQGGVYSVRIGNSISIAFSTNATLTVLVPAYVLAPPTNTAVLAGNTATFSVTAGGTPPFSYQWRFNGTNISGATDSTLSVPNAQFTSQGNYSVVITNAFGLTISSNATLTVNTPPFFTAQPVGRVASVASPAAFAVGVAGTPPFGYQWRFNGTNIPGSTAPSLIIPGVVPAHAGPYSVFVTNAYGSATSASATLTVIPVRVFSPWGTVAGGFGSDAASGVAMDSSGNAYVVGHFSGTANFGATQLTSSGARDGFLAKLNPAGQMLWVRALGGPGFDVVNAIAVDAAGNCYLTGNYEGIAAFGAISLTNTTAASFSDAFVAKFDTTGSALWARSLGVASVADHGNALALDGAGNVLVAGQSPFPSFSGVALTNHGRIFVAKYDNNGTALWARKAGGPGVAGHFDVGTAVTADAAGNVYLAGGFASPTATFDGGLSLSNEGALDGFLVRFDASGGLQWVRQFGGSQDSRPNGLAVDGAGNAYVAGEFSGTMQLPGASLSTAPSDQNIFVVRFSTSGTVDWARQAGGPLPDAARAVTVRGTNVFLAGYFSGTATFGTDTLVSAANTYDAFLARLDTNGTFAFAQQAGGNDLGGDYGLGLAVDANGNAILVGYFSGAGALGSTNATSTGLEDIFVTRFNTYTGDAPPTLGLLPMGGQLRFSWPLGSSSYILQSAPDLNPQSWVDVLGVLGVENSSLAMTNQVPVTNRFFRLRKP
jgi:M6 family metalloprotease-like protein